MIKKVTLGADPEVFLVTKGSGKFISSIGLIQGDKNYPQPISIDGHNVLCDNVSVEWNQPPSGTVDEFIANTNFCRNWIKDNIPVDLEISNKCVAYFDKDQLEDEGATTFGCDPDHNVYTNAPNEAPSIAMVKNMRAAAGHIHIGWNKPTLEDKKALIKAMDLFLALPALLVDQDNERRKMYGKAGCYRTKSYGVEFRTLSNFWVFEEELMKWVWGSTMKAIDFVNSGTKLSIVEELNVIKAINTYDKELAAKLCEEFNLSLLEYSK